MNLLLNYSHLKNNDLFAMLLESFDLSHLLNILNDKIPTFKFKLEIEENNELPFLDS